MAKKGRLYEVTEQNGFGQSTKYYPAQSIEDLKRKLPTSNDVKLGKVKSLGFQFFNAVVNEETSSLEFKTSINGENVYFAEGDIGYDYLTAQFPKQTNDVNEFIDEYRK